MASEQAKATGIAPEERGASRKILILPDGSPVRIESLLRWRYQDATSISRGTLFDIGATRQVVIKELSVARKDLQEREEKQQDVIRECLAAEILSLEGKGPHVYGVAKEEGMWYLVMDWMAQGDWNNSFEDRASLAYTEVLTIAEHMLEGLHLLHDPHPASSYFGHMQVLFPSPDGYGPRARHGDIKPGNAFRRDNRTYLADFGSTVGEEIGPTFISGTPDYLSPEQLLQYSSRTKDRHISRAADIYSLGVMLWELLTGEDHEALLSNQGIVVDDLTSYGEYASYINSQEHVVDMMNRLHEKRPDIPGSLSEIVEICLQPDPKDRFIAAFQMLQAVKDAQFSDFGPPPLG